MTYHDVNSESGVTRTFLQGVDDGELVWHRDEEDRIVKSLTHSDWKIQLDDHLPVGLNEEILVRKGEWHRLIKGTGDLIVKITKFNGK